MIRRLALRLFALPLFGLSLAALLRARLSLRFTLLTRFALLRRRLTPSLALLNSVSGLRWTLVSGFSGVLVRALLFSGVRLPLRHTLLRLSPHVLGAPAQRVRQIPGLIASTLFSITLSIAQLLIRPRL